MKIKQIHVPYWQWEDYKSGMWRKLSKDEEPFYEDLALLFISDWKDYGDAMMSVVNEWKMTMLNSLTTPSTNKKAFIGHCACSYKHNIPEYIVRRVWGKLTDKQREDADEIAQLCYLEWKDNYEKQYKSIHRDLDGSVLF
jgi:hypothetical protein